MPGLNESFDPLIDLFVAQSKKPANIGQINLRTLTPFQRALMVIDGTVTKFIEAYTMEPIEVVRISQVTRLLSKDHAWLKASRGMPSIVRQVILRGKYSYTFYAYAVSLLLPDRLPEVIKEKLEIDGEGLGRILLDSQMETYREVLWYGREHVEELPDALRHLTDGDFISRTYRIMAAGQPIMLINEKFPSNFDHLPAHH